MSRQIERWRRKKPRFGAVGRDRHILPVERQWPMITPPTLPSTLRLKSLILDEDLVVEGDVTTSPDSPDATASDGLPPSGSPTPTVTGGPRWLAVKWLAQTNVDLVTYEVHVGTSAAFATSATTLAAETPATLAFIRTVNGVPLAYGTNYYVKLIAKDVDGAADVGGEVGPTQLDPNATDDILAGSVTAEKLEAVLVLASALVAGTANAERVEVGFGTDGAGNLDSSFIGIRGYDPDGTTITFLVDVETGDVYLKGRLDFGDSRLLAENIVELGEINTTGFQTPALVQSDHRTSAASSTATCPWPTPTTFGNLNFIILMMYDTDGSVPASPSTPSGYTLEQTQVSADNKLRISIFRSTDGAVQSGTVSLTLGDTVLWEMQLLEYSGVQFGGLDQEDTDTGAATTSLTLGTFPGTTTQAEELWIGAIAHVTTVDAGDPGGTISNSYVKVRTTTNALTDGGDFKVAYLTTAAKNVLATGTNGGTMTTNSNVESFVGAVAAYKAKPAGVDTPSPNKIRIYNQNDRFEVPALYTKDDTGVVRAVRPFQDVESRINHIHDFTGSNFDVSAGANGNIDGMIAAITVGAASGVAAVAPESGHPGIVQLDQGSSTTGSAWIQSRGQAFFTANNDVIRMTAIIKTPGTLSNGTNRYGIAVGMLSAGGINPFDTTVGGVWVMYTDAFPAIAGGGTITNGDWGLLHGDGTDLAGDLLNDNGGGVTVAISTWYRIDLEHKVGTGTSVWINGVKKVNNFGTNLFAAGVNLQLETGTRKTLGATTRPVLVDLMAYEYVLATAR